jgi:outer membrane protein assembly factor BamB/subtilisin family serine protease
LISPKIPKTRAGSWLRCLLVLAAAAVCASAAPPPERNGPPTARELSQGYREGQVIAKPKAAMLAGIDAVEKGEGLTLRAKYERFGSLRVIGLKAGDTVKDAIGRLRATGRYDYVEPDYVRHGTKVPNDAQFANQWALHNDGSGGGIAGADIHAEAGWDVITNATSNVIVAIVDSGAFLTHEDLLANFWQNPTPGTTTSFPTLSQSNGSSSTDAVTDSQNGLNTVAGSGPPQDDLGHGTHVSGIVGAVGNNGLGVAGVAWKVQLMELKFIGSNDSGSTSDELPCIEYAVAHKVSVMNASYGDQEFSQAEMDAIHAAGQAGIIFVCAAGNSSENIDISGFFPADYPLDNIIAVGASDNRDAPVYFTNFGSGSVELFAPGEDILSTYNGGVSSYAELSGTSMAAPFVTGTVALLRSQFPSDTYRETINRVLNSVDVLPALAGKCQTSGRLNLTTALTTAANTPPNALFANRTNLVGLDPYTRSNNVDSPAALEAGTPSLTSGGGHSLWWQWTAPENAQVIVDTSGTGGGTIQGGSTYATALGVYTGSSLGSLTLVQSSVTFGTEPPEGGGSNIPFSQVTFHTNAGTTYQVNVQGQAGASGQTILAINTTPDNDAFAVPQVLAGPSVAVHDANINASTQAGEPKILGHSGGHSLWYSWTAPTSGNVQVSGYSYDFLPAVAVYTGTTITSLSLVASAAGGALAGISTVASQCLCTFTAAAGTTYMITLDGETSGDIGEFTLTIDDSLWQGVTGDAITCSPSIGLDGTVYVGSNDNSIYAYGPTGALKWNYAGQGVFDTSSAAVGADGTIYAGNTDGNLYALNPNGTLKWQYGVANAAGSGTTGNSITCSPSVSASGVVYFHGSDGHLYAVNPGGTLAWTAAVPGDSYAAPSIAPDGTIYVGTDGGAVYAVNADGSPKWTFSTPVSGDPIYTAPALDAAGNLYIGTLDGNFYSVSPSGKLLWSYAVGDGITSAPALANGAVYFGGYDGYLYALTASTGALQWKFSVGYQVRASGPAVDANGTIYVGSYDHNVYAVSPSGTLVRTYATDDYIRSSPLIGGTNLYIGSEDHKLYAFNIGVTAAASDWAMYQYDAHRVGRAESQLPTIVAQPAPQFTSVGSSATFSVTASGLSALTYQWNFNGAAIAGATGSSYTVSNAQPSNAGSYSVTVTDSAGSTSSAIASLTVNTGTATTRLINISTRAMVGTGGNILIPGFFIAGSGSETLLIRADGPGLAQFNVAGFLAQPVLTVFDASGNVVASNTGWNSSGNALQLATTASQVGAFALPAGSADSALIVTLPAGAYTVHVAGVNSGTGVALAEVYEVASTGTRLTNISTRAAVGTGANIIIPGFVIAGSGSEQLLVRGDGPALSQFGVTGVLAKPSLQVLNSSGSVIASNIGWSTASNASQIASYAAEVGAFSLTPGSADCALTANLTPGAYTIQVSGTNSTTGVALAEVYEIPQ